MNGNTNHHDVSDEQLDRHAAALRDEPVPPDGPSPEALGATLEMLRAQRVSPGRRSLLERALSMTFSQRITAAAIIGFGALTLHFAFGVFNVFSPSVAFADVADKLKDARTIQYTSTTTLPNGKTIAIRTLAAEPDMMRTEMPDGTVTINRGGVALTLNPTKKTASRTTFNGRPARPAGASGMVESIRSIGQRGGEPLGEKEIDGVTVVGFRTAGAPGPWTIWADKKTAAPVRVELTMHVNGGEAPMVLDKFVLDAPLDESLFSLEPPEGYTLKEQTLTLPKFGDLAEDVADLLRAYSDLNDGAFPAHLTDWAAVNKGGKQDPQIAMKVGGISGRLFGLRDGYGYAGKVVRRGERDKMVFWYKNQAGTYRAVFGDLRVADVASDKLPKAAMTKPRAPKPGTPTPMPK